MITHNHEVAGTLKPVPGQDAKLGTTQHPFADIQTKTLTATGAVATGALTVTGQVSASGGFTQPVTGLTTTGEILLYSKFKTGGTPWFQPDGINTKDLMDAFTLPGGTLTTGHKLRFTVYGVHTGNNANSCVVAITIGGTIVAYQATVTDGTDIASQSMANATTAFVLYCDMYQLEATVQRAFMEADNGSATKLAPVDTSLTQDMTTDKTLILSLKNVTAIADASIYGWTVELV